MHTQGSHLPKGWSVKRVGDVGEVRLGRQRSPAHEHGQFMTPYLRVANVFDGHIDYSDVLSMNFTPREREIYGLRDGDILLNEGQSLELVGRCAIYSGPPNTYCFQNTLVRYRCGPELIPKFAFFTFQRWLPARRFVAIAKQTTSIAHLGADRFASMAITLPSVQEQQSIVEVLDSVDNSIHATERFIDKQESTVEAVRHALLAKNFTVNQLSAYLSSSPGAVVQTGPFGSQLHAHEYVADGVPVIMPQDIVAGNIDDRSIARITEARASTLGRHRLRAGDIVLARRGDLTKCAVISPAQEGWLCGTGCLLLRPGTAINPYWLAAMYRHDTCQRQIGAVAVGSTMVNLNTRILLSLNLPWPPKKEQDRIAEIIGASGEAVERTRRRRAKLRKVKQGLMEDLLTGRVAVKGA